MRIRFVWLLLVCFFLGKGPSCVKHLVENQWDDRNTRQVLIARITLDKVIESTLGIAYVTGTSNTTMAMSQMFMCIRTTYVSSSSMAEQTNDSRPRDPTASSRMGTRTLSTSGGRMSPSTASPDWDTLCVKLTRQHPT
jgi:hypothetical protein